MNDYVSIAESWRTNLEKQAFEVAFIGVFGVGKSTLVNCLLGNDFLPNETSLITSIKAGTNSLIVNHGEGSENISDFSSPTAKDIGDKLGNLYQRNPNSFKTAVELELASTNLDNRISVVDTPGIGTINRKRDEAVYDYLNRADTLVIVLNASKPLSLIETKFIQKRLWEEGIRNVFFILNKIDLLPDIHSRESVIDHTKKKLREMLRIDPLLYPMSSLMALNGILWKQEATDHPSSIFAVQGYDGPDHLLEHSGFSDFKRALDTFLGSDLWAMSQVEHTLGRLRLQMNSMIENVSRSENGRQLQVQKNPIITSVQEWAEQDSEKTVEERIEAGRRLTSDLATALKSVSTTSSKGKAQDNVANVRNAVSKKSKTKLNFVTDKPKPEAVFISYSRRDFEGYVSPLVQKLHAAGIDIWIDQECLHHGDWMDKINEALEICGRMILCISPEALESKFVKLEYRYFITSDKPIFPIMCRDVKLPPELSVIQYKRFDQIDQLIKLVKNNNV